MLAAQKTLTAALQDCRKSKLQEGKDEGLPLSLPAILQFCHPAIAHVSP
jgi:hypothetical protein